MAALGFLVIDFPMVKAMGKAILIANAFGPYAFAFIFITFGRVFHPDEAIPPVAPPGMIASTNSDADKA
jgi:hypothetical protein